MSRPQFPIRAALALVAVAGVGWAALVKPSFLWAGVWFTATMTALGLSLVAAAVRRGRARPFWLGFAVFGWGHMVLALGPWFEDATGELIITRQLLELVGPAVGHEVVDPFGQEGIWRYLSLSNSPRAGMQGYASRTKQSFYYTYIVVGQSMTTLLIATAGGFISQYLLAHEAR